MAERPDIAMPEEDIEDVNESSDLDGSSVDEDEDGSEEGVSQISNASLEQKKYEFSRIGKMLNFVNRSFVLPTNSIL